MAVLSLVGIDAKQFEPLAVMALAGVAGYFLWQHLNQRQQAQSSSITDTSNPALAGGAAALNDLEQLAVLQALTHTTTASATNNGTTNANTSSTAGTATPGSSV